MGTALTATKYLTFSLGSETYGLDVLRVVEVARMMPITPLHRMPACVKGVINLRGNIVPVIDLRTKLGMEPEPIERATRCILVLIVKHGDAARHVGMIVDAVDDVLSFKEEEVESSNDKDTPHIIGLAKHRGSLRILIDVDQLITPQTLTSVPS